MSDHEVNPTPVADLVALNVVDPRNLTEVGLGARLVDEFSDSIRFLTDARRWLVWSEHGWQSDDERSSLAYGLVASVLRIERARAMEMDNENGARDAALRTIASFETVRKRRAILEHAATDPRIATTEPQLDLGANEIVCLNGVVNLDTGELRRVRPGDMTSLCAVVDYDPKALARGYAPELDVYLDTFLPDQVDQRFVFAVLGDALRSGNARRWLPIFWGETTTGKSQLFAALHRMLGSYVVAVGSSIFRGNLDDKPRPDLVAAIPRRLAVAQEASPSWALHADQVKRLTGGDVLPYRQLYGALVNRPPAFTPILVTNSLPRIAGSDPALKRRILAVPFDRTLEPGTEDPSLRAAFVGRASGPDAAVGRALFARLVRGASDRILDEVPERYALATLNARAGLDHLDEYLLWLEEDRITVKLGDDAPASQAIRSNELYATYRYWLKKVAGRIDRVDELGRNQFVRSIRDRGWTQVRSDGSRWLGVGLAPGAPVEIRYDL